MRIRARTTMPLRTGSSIANSPPIGAQELERARERLLIEPGNIDISGRIAGARILATRRRPAHRLFVIQFVTPRVV